MSSLLPEDRRRLARASHLSLGGRRQGAQERNQARAGRDPLQQLVLLDERLGTDEGATCERARLLLTLSEDERRGYDTGLSFSEIELRGIQESRRRLTLTVRRARGPRASRY